MTQAEFKIKCALVKLAGLDRETGLSPAECVQTLEEIGEKERQRSRVESPAARRNPPSRQPQLDLR